jgi:hypothetical protein
LNKKYFCAKTRIVGHIPLGYLKNISKTSNIAAFNEYYRSKTLKNGYFGQKWPNFGLKRAKISPY